MRTREASCLAKMARMLLIAEIISEPRSTSWISFAVVEPETCVRGGRKAGHGPGFGQAQALLQKGVGGLVEEPGSVIFPSITCARCGARRSAHLG